MGQAWKRLLVTATCTHLARTRSHGPTRSCRGGEGNSVLS